MTAITATAPRKRDAAYWRLWQKTPREVAYLLIGFPIALVGFIVTITLFSTGVGTIVTFFLGVILIIAALYVARGFGSLEIALLRWTGRPEITKPDWQDDRARTGFMGWLKALFANGHYWLYLLYVMVVDFVLKVVSWSITLAWVATSLGGLTFWIWGNLPGVNAGNGLFDLLASRLNLSTFAGQAFEILLNLLLGLIALATLPFVSRGLVSLHWLVSRGMLSAFRSDALRIQVRSLTDARGAALSAEGHSLRRLERDIHDGPQQRLVRLQMDLAAAERQLDTDPEKSRALISEAMEQSKEALEELRALSRGFAPPILLDRGLVAALESAGARSTVPARIVDELPAGTELPLETERNAYFIASEALTNAAKHSGASEVEARVSIREMAELNEKWLQVVVTDNGNGGAMVLAGHGIEGLQERLRGLGGTLEITSPAGGPTVVTARLPLEVVATETGALGNIL